jgi:NAD(P)-dependent dehydrogenase (short-subunit alcohol dehydrogenase family)
MPFRDETVVITGAAGGIGSALARRFAREGARLALLDRESDGIETLAVEIEALGASALPVRCDVTSLPDCEAALDSVIGAFGGVDVLVNNAGITHLGPFHETDVEVVRRVMEVNFFGSVHCTKAALASLLERRGRIVVISSVAGIAPLATRTGYAASKYALHGFFESLRAETHSARTGVLHPERRVRVCGRRCSPRTLRTRSFELQHGIAGSSSSVARRPSRGGSPSSRPPCTSG